METADAYTDILSRNGLQDLRAQAGTKVSTRQQTEANRAVSGSPEAEIEEESKGNPFVKVDEKTDRKPFSFHLFGAHPVKVLVDTGLGMIRVDKAVAVMDVGTIMNMKTAINQITGGMIFEIGMALMEETNYNPNRGRPVTKDLANYLVPVHAGTPKIQVEFINKPDLLISPIGARGVGETGTAGITAAINNAIYHATVKRIRELPVTPDKILQGKRSISGLVFLPEMLLLLP